MPAKRKLTRREVLKKTAKIAAGLTAATALAPVPGCAPVKFSKREVAGLIFSSKEARDKKIRAKFIQAQLDALTGKKPGKKSSPAKAKSVKKRIPTRAALRHGLSVKPQWNEIFKVYPRWNPARYKGSARDYAVARVGLINRVSMKSGLSPAQVLLTIVTCGTKAYHLNGLKTSVKWRKERLVSASKAERSKLLAKNTELERDIRVLEALFVEKAANRRLVIDTVNSAKPLLCSIFQKRDLERILKGQKL